jgi:hypothetical protein
MPKIDMGPFLLLPNTRRQRDEGAATVEFDQRVVVVLEWLVEGFGGVSKEFGKFVMDKGDECMHVSIFGFLS